MDDERTARRQGAGPEKGPEDMLLAEYPRRQQRLLDSLIKGSSIVFALGILINSVCFLWDFWNTLFQNALGAALLVACWVSLRFSRRGSIQKATRIYLAHAMGVTALVTLFIGQNAIPHVVTVMGLLVLIAIFLESPVTAYRWGAVSIGLYYAALTGRVLLGTRELILSSNDLVVLYVFPAMFLSAFAFVGARATGRLDSALSESEKARGELEDGNRALQDADAALREANERMRHELAERREAEAALREREENFRALAENANDGIIIVAGDGSHLYGNSRAAQILGYDLAELLEVGTKDVVHPNDLGTVLARQRQRLAGEPAQSQYEINCVRRDGSPVPVGVGATRTVWQGEPATIVMLTDITERRRVEEEARRYTAQLEALREVGLELTAEVDLDTLLRSIVLRAAGLVGAVRGSVYLYRPGQEVLERTAASDPYGGPESVVLHRGEGLSGWVWETGETQIVDVYEDWEGRADVWEGYPTGAAMGVPVQWGPEDDESEFLGVLTVAAGAPNAFSPDDARLLGLFATEAAVAIRNAQLHDEARREIAERRQVERALRESEGRFRSLSASAPIGIFLTDAEGRFIYTNSYLRAIAGLTPEEAEGFGWRQIVHPDDRDGVVEQAIQMLGPDLEFSREFRIMTSEGETRWVYVHTAPMMSPDGEYMGQVGTAEDITERRQTERAIARHERDLRSLSARLLSAQEAERLRISQELHDEMGQALTALKINLAVIQEELPSDSAPVISERLAEASSLTDYTLQQMREMAHELRPSMLDDLGLVPVLHWYVDRYSRRLDVEVELEVSGIEERLPSDVETALYRVVQEALTNVARHAEARTVWIRLERTGCKVLASIEDDGGGFDVGRAARRASSEGGAGLIGMRERIASLGGSLRITSRPGEGTLLSMEIPVRETPVPGPDSDHLDEAPVD